MGITVRLAGGHRVSQN